jgi:hypothetical protein
MANNFLDWLATPNPAGFTASQFAMTNTKKKKTYSYFADF